MSHLTFCRSWIAKISVAIIPVIHLANFQQKMFSICLRLALDSVTDRLPFSPEETRITAAANCPSKPQEKTQKNRK